MGIFTAVRDFLTGADLRPRDAPPIERRDALGALPILYQQGKAQWTEYDTLGAYRTFAISTVIYACVMLRARCLSAATVRVYRGQDAEKEPANTHRLRRLMMHPNPFMSEAEFLSLVSLIADVANFCVIEKARSPSGAVVGLYPLRSDWLKAIPRANAAPDWEYRIPGYDRPFSLSARDVIVYTVGQGPAMSPTGFGPMNVSFREASIDKAMTDFLKAFFDNGAVPLIGLVPSEAASEMTQDDADALRERFRQLKLTGDPLVMTAITDVKRLGFDFDELAYPELRELTEQHICQAWGVPQTLIGAAGGENEATYSNAQTYLRQFYWTTVQPLWARLDGALSRSLVPEFGDPDLSLEFDTSEIDALAEDDTTEKEQTIKLWQVGGIVRDELRARFGYDELGGEVGMAFYDPLSAATFPGDERAAAIRVRSREIAAVPLRSLTNGHALHPLRPEVRAALTDRNRAAVARLGRRWAPIVRRFWREQGERIAAAAIRSGDAAPETRDVAAVDWADEEARLADLLSRLYANATQTAWAIQSDALSLSIAYDVTNPYVAAVLDDLATRVVGINATTRDDVRRVVGQAIEEGVTLDELASRLKGLFTETYRGRSLTVARTESQVGYNLGSAASYRASGEVSFVELLDNPEHTDDYGASDGLSCAERNGLVVPLDRIAHHVAAEHPNGSLAVVPIVNALEA